MSKPAAEERWQRFAAAARHGAPAATPGPLPGMAPAGFVARVVARAMQARREFVSLLWARWSWWTAVAAAGLAVAVAWLVMRHAAQPCLEVPSVTLEVPQLSSP